jgi:hypothetical protein
MRVPYAQGEARGRLSSKQKSLRLFERTKEKAGPRPDLFLNDSTQNTCCQAISVAE